ncbi:MAG: TerB family tellurite resistance protein [Myxococcota bacterium]
MSDPSHRSLLDRLWGRDGRLTPALLADVLLMASLADGRLTEPEIDALSWAVAHRPELAGLQWNWLVERAAELGEDAPLFADVRKHLSGEVTDPKDRRLALTLANRVASADHPLVDEEEALLRSLAEAFEISEAEQAELLRPAPPGAAAFTWRRTRFADPKEPPLRYFDALAQAREPGEARVLIHRLHAARTLWDGRFKGGQLESLGHSVAVDDQHFMFDAVFDHQDRTIWVRTLATGESLYPRERKLLPKAAARRPRAADVLITHSGPLSPADRTLFDAHESLSVMRLAL